MKRKKWVMIVTAFVLIALILGVVYFFLSEGLNNLLSSEDILNNVDIPSDIKDKFVLEKSYNNSGLQDVSAVWLYSFGDDVEEELIRHTSNSEKWEPLPLEVAIGNSATVASDVGVDWSATDPDITGYWYSYSYREFEIRMAMNNSDRWHHIIELVDDFWIAFFNCDENQLLISYLKI